MDTPNRLPYEKFKDIYSIVPRLAVEVVVIKDKKILLTKRTEHGWAGMWHTPGGTVMYRESLQDAVRRLAREELGVDVEVGRLLGYIETWSEEAERGFGYSVSLPFLVKPESFNFVLNSQATEYAFFTDLSSKVIPEHKAFYEGVNFQSL
ncbi:NUDIX domain-containing protein [Candidatus Woesebacteria bacterium]|nr:NUDIX domain-containing protein [Candidatus Woesebacteria bacterium]